MTLKFLCFYHVGLLCFYRVGNCQCVETYYAVYLFDIFCVSNEMCLLIAKMEIDLIIKVVQSLF